MRNCASFESRLIQVWIQVSIKEFNKKGLGWGRFYLTSFEWGGDNDDVDSSNERSNRLALWSKEEVKAVANVSDRLIFSFSMWYIFYSNMIRRFRISYFYLTESRLWSWHIQTAIEQDISWANCPCSIYIPMARAKI
jgi:hypothetical protein